MRADAPPPDDPDDPSREAVDRAAAIDDFFGGFATDLPEEGKTLRSDDGPLPGSLDLLLLLRQAGATGTSVLPPAPDRIARYQVRRLAGRGGFSTVWEAVDPVLRRRVAVKVCSPDALVSPTLRRRFRREAELASRLVHPHIVAIHEVGEADGLEFITTEFCDGGTLAEWLARHRGPVPPTVAARIARALAHAAAHAHAEDVIHRDIKPANVMLVPVDGHDESACTIPPQSGDGATGPVRGMTVKLADFGLGRQGDPRDGEDPLTQLTTEGSRLGTPAWMAPEQIDRSFGPVGPATDVHAIGLLLDRMLTGRTLRGGKTDVETYREVLLDEPVAANRVARGIPADLAAVCLKCLAKHPSDRYPSAESLADDLGRWLAGLPTRARPLTPFQRVARSVARRPLVAGLVAAASLAMGLAGWAAVERSRERSTAAIHREEVRRQSAAAELRRGFESLRSGNVAGALDQIAKTRDLDSELAGSLAARWLERRLHGEREILLRPAATVGETRRRDLHCLAISPDGSAAAVGGADGRLRLLRTAEGGATVTEIEAHDEVNDVCFSHDGHLVASVGQDGRLRWWRTDRTDAPVGEVRPAGCPLYAVTFSADDSTLWYGGEDRVVRRVDVANESPPRDVQRLGTLGGDASEIEAMVNAGRVLVVACGGELVAIDTADGHPIWSWRHRDARKRQAVINALAVSPDERVVTAGGTDRDLGCWDVATGAHLATFPAHPNWIQACGYSRDGSQVATACRDGIVRVFDTSTRELKSKLVGHAGRSWDVAFESDGTLLSAGADGTLRRWNPSADASTAVLRELASTGPAIRTLRDATLPGQAGAIVAVRGGTTPALFDAVTGALAELAVGPWLPNEGVATDLARGRVAFGLNGDATGRAPIVLSLDGVSNVPAPAPLPGADQPIGPYVCWTPDGRLVANAADGSLYAWSPTLDRVARIGPHQAGCFRVAAAPCGPPRLAIAGRPSMIMRCDDLGTAILSSVVLTRGDEMVSAIAWSPDGHRLVCGMRHGEVHVFDGETGQRLGTLAPHERQIADVAWSADGRTILSADAECVRIADSATFAAFDDLTPGWHIETMCLAGRDRFVVIAGHGPNPGSVPQARLALIDLKLP